MAVKLYAIASRCSREETEGVSINSLVTAIIAEAIGAKRARS
jgi:hypothetical protein